MPAAGGSVPTVAGAAAWLVVGAKHHLSVYLDAARAAEVAVEQHGVLLPLVLADEVSEMLKAAFVQGQTAVRGGSWRVVPGDSAAVSPRITEGPP